MFQPSTEKLRRGKKISILDADFTNSVEISNKIASSKSVNILVILVHQIQSVACIAGQVGRTVYCTASDQISFSYQQNKVSNIGIKGFPVMAKKFLQQKCYLQCDFIQQMSVL